MRHFIFVVGLACCWAACLAYDDAEDAYENEGYATAEESKPQKVFETGFIIECYGAGKMCVRPDLCNDGSIDYGLAQEISNRNDKCEIGREVCCAVRKEEIFLSSTAAPEYQAPEYIPPIQDQSPDAADNIPDRKLPDGVGEEILGPQIGCAAALLCVEERFCDAAGSISPNPVSLTEEQLLRRVPVVDCRNQETGIIGKCCRDPNYVDPWPAGLLPANYTGGFDDQGFPKIWNVTRGVSRPAGVFRRPINTVDDSFVPPQINFESGRLPVRPPQATQRPFSQTGFQLRPNAIPATAKPAIAVITQRPTQFIQQLPDQAPTNTINLFLQRETVTTQRPINGGINLPRFPATQAVPAVPAPENILSGEGRLVPEVLPSQRPKNILGLSTDVKDFIVSHQPGKQCGLLNKVVRRPTGLDVDIAAFGEVPWQAMILNNVEKKLICSGVIIAPNAILTSAHCVQGRVPSEVSAKSGEWKLGYDLKHEEPLDFEIVTVQNIVVHPQYKVGYPSHDVAILLLEKSFKLDQHVDSICLNENEITTSRKCISTGWGKEVIRIHAPGAKMNRIQVDILSADECNARIANAESPVDFDESHICAKAKKVRNNMCQVDLGSPLACDRGDGIYEVVGIYSEDTGCIPTNQVATYARIDVQWVREILENPQILVQSLVPQTVRPLEYASSTVPTTATYYQSSTVRPTTQYYQSTTQYVPSVTSKPQAVFTTQRPSYVQPTTPRPQYIQPTPPAPIARPQYVQSQIVPQTPEQQYIRVTTTELPTHQVVQITSPKPFPILVQENKPAVQNQVVSQGPKYQYTAQYPKLPFQSTGIKQQQPVQVPAVQPNYVIEQQRPVQQTQYFYQQQRPQVGLAYAQRQPQYIQQSSQSQFVQQKPISQETYAAGSATTGIQYRPGPVKLHGFYSSNQETPYFYQQPPAECPCRKNKETSQQYLPPV